MGKTKQHPTRKWKCSVCLRLEDEYHFELECQMYIELRKTYISPYLKQKQEKKKKKKKTREKKKKKKKKKTTKKQQQKTKTKKPPKKQTNKQNKHVQVY